MPRFNRITFILSTILWSTISLASPKTVYFEVGNPTPTALNTTTTLSTTTLSSTTQDTTLIPNNYMPPTVSTQPAGNYISTITINVGCSYFGVPVTNCEIVFSNPYPEPYSGGHDHDDTSRPGGTLDPMAVFTGTNYTAPVTYTAPEVSGYIHITGTATLFDFGLTTTTQYIVQVYVPNLVELPPGSDYDLVGQYGTLSPSGQPVKSEHYHNHFGTPALVAGIIKLSDEYHYEYPGDNLEINDMSLKWGGIFDIDNSWFTPHKVHRFGKNVDIAFVNVHNRMLFKFLAYMSGFNYILVEDSQAHYHITVWH